jgi:hypothetical protein
MGTQKAHSILFQVDLGEGRSLRIDVPVTAIEQRLNWLQSHAVEREAKRLTAILQEFGARG